MRGSDDRGLSLIEMLIAMSLLLVALAMFTLALSSMQNATARQDQLGRAADSAYLALTEMDRQLRSGYIASETQFSGSDAGATLKDMVRIYTESYAPPSSAAAPNTVARCVAWAVVQIDATRQGLYTIWWTPTPNGSQPTYSAATRRFTVPSTASPGVTNVAGVRLVSEDLIGADANTFTVLTASPGSDLSQRLSVTFNLRETADGVLLTPVPGSPSPWVNTISTTMTPRNSPRSSMSADTSVYSASRGSLCG